MEKTQGQVILIVEDNTAHEMVLRVLCEKFGFTTSFVRSGEEAIDTLMSCPTCYDAVLMDRKLSGMDGCECTRLIRQLEEPLNRRTPIIAITACAMEGDREECLSAGMDDYMTKPFTADGLRKILLRWTYNATRPNLKLLPRPCDNSTTRDAT